MCPRVVLLTCVHRAHYSPRLMSEPGRTPLWEFPWPQPTSAEHGDGPLCRMVVRLDGVAYQVDPVPETRMLLVACCFVACLACDLVLNHQTPSPSRVIRQHHHDRHPVAL